MLPHSTTWAETLPVSSPQHLQDRAGYTNTTWQCPPQLKRTNAPCENMSCQAELRTQDLNFWTESKFPLGDRIGPPLTMYPHRYKISGENAALNHPGAGRLSWVPPCQLNILLHLRISASRGNTICSIWFGNRSENLPHISTLTKPRTLCGTHRYRHLFNLVEVTCFYDLNINCAPLGENTASCE